MNPISSGSEAYSTSSSSVALPESGLVTDSTSLPADSASFTARPRSLEMVEFFDLGAVLTHVERLRSALAAARARRPDLVLTDVMMPTLDGFGLLRLLRQDAKPFWALLEATTAEDAGGAPVCQLVMNDITLIKQKDEERDAHGRAA